MNEIAKANDIFVFFFFVKIVNTENNCMEDEGVRIISTNFKSKSMLQEEECQVPISTVDSLVGSACDSLSTADISVYYNDEANVPSNLKQNSNGINDFILGKLYSTEENSGQPKKNLIKENIERIKEHVNNSDNYARTEIEQVHRPCGVHTIGRQITSSVNKEAEIVKKELNVERGLVSRAKEGDYFIYIYFNLKKLHF